MKLTFFHFSEGKIAVMIVCALQIIMLQQDKNREGIFLFWKATTNDILKIKGKGYNCSKRGHKRDILKNQN